VEVVIAPGYRPHQKQLEFHNSRARFRVCAAGVRAGKSYSATVEFLRSIYRDLAAGKGKRPAGTGRRRQPRLLYWAVAPTTALNVHVHRYIQSECPPELIERVYDDAIWLKPEILVEFKTAERPDLLVGASVSGLLVDEACRVRAEAWDGALRGRLADTAGFAILASSPTGGRNNWVYKNFVARSGADDIESFHWRTVDNTAVPDLVRDVEHARATMAESFFKREFEASWDSFGGAIYEEFSDAHVTTEQQYRFEHGLGNRPLSDCFNRIISIIDYGHTVNGCMLTIGEMGERNWAVIDEVYAPGIRPVSGSSKTWLAECQRVQREYGVRDFIGDPEDAGANFDLRNNGIPIRAASKQIYTGIRRVASAMHIDPATKKPGLRIFDRCKNTIREARNYMWKPNKEQTGFLEEPAPNQDDHAMDCLRYGAMELRLYDYVEGARNNTERGRGPYR